MHAWKGGRGVAKGWRVSTSRMPTFTSQERCRPLASLGGWYAPAQAVARGRWGGRTGFGELDLYGALLLFILGLFREGGQIDRDRSRHRAPHYSVCSFLPSSRRTSLRLASALRTQRTLCANEQKYAACRISDASFLRVAGG